MVLSVLAIASFASWFLSMLAGAGSPLVLMPLVNWLCGSAAVAPVLTLGMLLGNGQRVFMLWSHIDWQLTRWYLPGAVAGAILGAYLLSSIQLEGLQWVIALALIAMAIRHWQSDRRKAVSSSLGSSSGDDVAASESASESATDAGRCPSWAFLPCAFLNAIGSALIGSTGPILNPLYLNYGLVKEDMIGTKAFHNASLHVIKLAAYLYFGTITQDHITYGLIIGAAAIPGNWLGQEILKRMSPDQFKQAAFAFVAFSGVLMLWRQTALVL